MGMIPLYDCILVNKAVFHDKIQFLLVQNEFDIFERIAVPQKQIGIGLFLESMLFTR